MCLHPQPIGLQYPDQFDLVCTIPVSVDMPCLSNIFGLAPPKSPTPRPASKRRASPSRDSPVHDEQEELDNIPMEQMNYKHPAPSNAQMSTWTRPITIENPTLRRKNPTQRKKRRGKSNSPEKALSQSRRPCQESTGAEIDTEDQGVASGRAIAEETESDNRDGHHCPEGQQ